MNTRPDRSEAAEYYFTYINQVGEGDIRVILDEQTSETLTLLQDIDETASLYRYAPDKWSIRQVLSHVNDTERAFVFRALWFARGFESPLPSFDQDVAIAGAGADERSWSSHIASFEAVRAAPPTCLQTLRTAALAHRSTVSSTPFSVRALADITAGHLPRHGRVLRERYLVGGRSGAGS